MTVFDNFLVKNGVNLVQCDHVAHLHHQTHVCTPRERILLPVTYLIEVRLREGAEASLVAQVGHVVTYYAPPK